MVLEFNTLTNNHNIDNFERNNKEEKFPMIFRLENF